MALNDMAMILGGFLIAKPSAFLQIEAPNETDRRTLGGTLYTDFINIARTWKVDYKLISQEDFAVLRQLWINQYRNYRYPVLQFNAYGVYAPVKIEMSDRNLKYNGAYIVNFSMTLREQYAIS